MFWYEYIVPATLIAIMVRLEATFLGPYWSWIELLPGSQESPSTATLRLKALARRVLIPGLVSFALIGVWPERYSGSDLPIIAVTAALLLLWPLLFHGPPIGIRSRDWELPFLYLGFVGSFAASAWAGVNIAVAAAAEHGNVGNFMRTELLDAVVAVVVTLFFVGGTHGASTRASRKREENLRS